MEVGGRWIHFPKNLIGSCICSKDWNVVMYCNLISSCFLWMMPILPPLPAGRGRWTNLKPAGVLPFFTALSLSSLPNHVSVTATRSKLFETIWSLIMAALFLRERLLIRQVEANFRHPSADMLWRGIEINVREGLSLFKLDWIWWSGLFHDNLGHSPLLNLPM